MHATVLENHLRALSKPQLLTIAATMGASVQDKATKAAVIEMLLTQPHGNLRKALKLTWWEVNKGDFFMWTGLIVGVASILFSLWVYQAQKRDQETKDQPKKPSFSIGWYQENDGKLTLLDNAPIKIVVDETVVREQAIKLPVNLAFKNSGQENLEIVNVMLSYPSWAKVKSSGRGQIDPQAGRIVYSHDIGTLPAVSTFTPLSTIDTLVIPYAVYPIPVLAKAKDGIPVHMVIVAGYPPDSLAGRRFDLEVTITCKGHLPVTTKFPLTMPLAVNIADPDDKQVKNAAVSESESSAIANQIAATSEILDAWSSIYSRDGSKIDYAKIRSGGDILQVVKVDGVLRRVNLDKGADGTCDFEYLDEDNNGVLEFKLVHRAGYPLLDWFKPSASD